MINSFLLALQFLTIIPVTFTFNASNKELGKSALFYPIIGLLIGCLLLASNLVVNHLSSSIQAALILIVWVLITGGLHLDGLADCADAWVGGFGSKQRSLDIMKDPASGPIAVMVLILLILLKWSLISSILEKQLINALLLAPFLGRLAILILMSTSHYIRQGGLGEKITLFLPRLAVKNTIVLCLFIAIFFSGILPILFMLLVIFIIRFNANKRLAGITGDVYGATVELVEVSILLALII